MNRALLAVVAALVVGYAAGTCRYTASLKDIEETAALRQAEIDTLVARADAALARGPDTVLVQRVVRAAARVDTVAVTTDSAVAAITDSATRDAVATAIATERTAQQARLDALALLHAAELAVRDSAIDVLRNALSLERKLRLDIQRAKRADEWLNCAVGPAVVTGTGGVPRLGLGVACGIEVF